MVPVVECKNEGANNYSGLTFRSVNVCLQLNLKRTFSQEWTVSEIEQSFRPAKLVLQDGTTFEGYSFGDHRSVAGEVVFNTGMVGYTETLTDPSYCGQLLTLTYPLVGNYGVPAYDKDSALQTKFESEKIQVRGLLVSDYSVEYSHWDAERSLMDWLKSEGIPALTGIDTRTLTKKIREKGTMLGKILVEGQENIDFYDPDMENLVAQTSCSDVHYYGEGEKKVVLVDCGCKHNIIHHLLAHGVRVKRVPWDYPFGDEDFDGLMLSNGPGNPKFCKTTIEQIRKVMARKKPIFGICMGHQLLALAAGANTYKLKYGHRGQNQPALEVGTNRCLVTSQNHSYAVNHETMPDGWSPWFVNLNDGTNEGLQHESGLFFSVQFHPEAAPGPVDAGFLFERFVGLFS
jgi:carbamoyl-phosphate synthase small subunit